MPRQAPAQHPELGGPGRWRRSCACPQGNGVSHSLGPAAEIQGSADSATLGGTPARLLWASGRPPGHFWAGSCIAPDSARWHRASSFLGLCFLFLREHSHTTVGLHLLCSP